VDLRSGLRRQLRLRSHVVPVRKRSRRRLPEQGSASSRPRTALHRRNSFLISSGVKSYTAAWHFGWRLLLWTVSQERRRPIRALAASPAPHDRPETRKVNGEAAGNEHRRVGGDADYRQGLAPCPVAQRASALPSGDAGKSQRRAVPSTTKGGAGVGRDPTPYVPGRWRNCRGPAWLGRRAGRLPGPWASRRRRRPARCVPSSRARPGAGQAEQDGGCHDPARRVVQGLHGAEAVFPARREAAHGAVAGL